MSVTPIGDHVPAENFPLEQSLEVAYERLDMLLAKRDEEIAAAEARGYQRAIADMSNRLGHHLKKSDDPCQDRGVEWPCDVADELTEQAERTQT